MPAIYFPSLGKERGTSRAICSPLNHGSPCYLEVININWPCPTQSMVTVGWLYFEIELLSSHELLCAVCFYMSVYVCDVPRSGVISPFGGM